MTKNFLPKIFTFLINFLYLECFLPHSFNPKFFGPKIFLDLNFFGLKISWPRFFLTKNVLDPTKNEDNLNNNDDNLKNEGYSEKEDNLKNEEELQ